MERTEGNIFDRFPLSFIPEITEILADIDYQYHNYHYVIQNINIHSRRDNRGEEELDQYDHPYLDKLPVLGVAKSSL